MADNRTMEEMLQAPTKGYRDAIVTTHLKNEITRFTQKFEETFREAWERFKEMLRQCPHHGFSELHQIDTFYNGLNEHAHDSLNAAAGGNLLSKTPRDALAIIENKSKVRYSRDNPVASKVSTTSSGSSSSTDARIDKLTDTISNLVETFNKKMTTPATVKEYQEKDKIGSKPDKKGMRDEAGKSQKQLQWIKEVKLKKTQKEGPEMQIIQSFIRRMKLKGLKLQLLERRKRGIKSAEV
nr:reverse transcriptase domain-containing protein [Tanacetum cinerariifolium]